MTFHTRTLGLRNRKSQQGMTAAETLVALGILLIVASGVMGLAAVAVTTTENQGHLAARAAEYAQDKMEQLMALKFCDSTSNTAPTSGYVTSPTGGTGLAGCASVGVGGAPSVGSAGGGLNTAAPVAQYVDYLDASGNPVAAGGNWAYIRVWQISIPAGTTGLKQITVKAQVRNTVGGNAGLLPNATVIALKSDPF
jgi:type II secretory pathway pseudopilin PulG